MLRKAMTLEDVGLGPVKNMNGAAWCPPTKSYSLPVEECIISYLPFPATEAGEFKSIHDMTVKELLKFIAVVLDAEDRRSSRAKSAIRHVKPEWWPPSVPYPSFFTILRKKSATQAHGDLLALLRQCYEAAECSLVLDFADYLCNDGRTCYTKIVHPDRNVSVQEACGRLVASVSAENMKLYLNGGNLEKSLNGFPREVLQWSQGPSRPRTKHDFVKLFPTPPVLDLTLSDSALYDEPDYTLVDFTSPLGRHVLRHSTINAGFTQIVSFMENERFCSTNPKVVKESVAASQRLPMPGGRTSNATNTRYGARRRKGMVQECRDYCFTAEEKRERRHSLLTGFNAEARKVIHECRGFDVDLGRSVCKQYLDDLRAKRVARFRGGRRPASAASGSRGQDNSPDAPPSEQEPQPCSSSSLCPTSEGGPSSSVPSTSVAVTDMPGSSASASASCPSSSGVMVATDSPSSSSKTGSTSPSTVQVASNPSTSADALGPQAAEDENEEVLLSDPDEPGPATAKREAAIRKNVPPDEALSSFPKVIVERSRDVDPNAPKRSRILASLMRDECKELRNLGLGELLENQTRQTRHSELKPEVVTNVRKRRRTARSIVVNAGDVDGGNEDKKVKRASLPAVNVHVDENKPVDEQKLPGPPAVGRSKVIKEERVLREKEAKGNVVQEAAETKRRRGRPRRVPGAPPTLQVDPALVVTHPRSRIPRALNLPAASNTRSKTGTGTIGMKLSPAELHNRFMADYGVLCVISVRRFKEEHPHLGCCGFNGN